jgi:hypothetical protein
MESWLVSLIIALASGGSVLGVATAISQGIKNDVKKEVESFVTQFRNISEQTQKTNDERNSLIMRQLESMAEAINKVVAIEKESSMTKEILFTHIEDNKRSIERIHDKMDKAV